MDTAGLDQRPATGPYGSLRARYFSQRLGNSELARARKERYLRRQAEQLGFALTPVHGEVS